MAHDNLIFDLLNKELKRQREGIELIASENFTSLQVMQATGSVATNKYAEGYPGKRYYGGCEVIDEIETIAINRLKQVFNASWANVQPHSGAQANAAVFLACLKPGDKILGLDLSMGGHLTHGSPANFSGKTYQSFFYGVDRETGLVNYEQLEATARTEKPKMIICGASAYSRDLDYEKFREIADEVDALLLADISHPSGLIARGLLNDPLPHCDFVTTTTHKTLRGPRGGMILMGQDFDNPFGLTTPKGEMRSMSSLLDGAVFPGIQGGPLEHVIGAKAVAFGEALTDEYFNYILQVKKNALALANALQSFGYHIVSGGTDNHLMLIDLRNKDISGKEAVAALGQVHITANKNMVPYDDKSPFVTSGIRLGTPAVTTRGLVEADMVSVAGWINEALVQRNNESHLKTIAHQIESLMANRPLFMG